VVEVWGCVGVTAPTVFVASEMPTAYPFKLQKPRNVTPSVRETAETFIFDSGIGDDETNADVLATAERVEADYVIAKDYLHDQPATTASVEEFLTLYDEPHPSTPMLPLQPPHADHYESLPRGLRKSFDVVCLGGMATEDISDDQAVRWITDAARVVPNDVHIHALGVGGGIEFIRHVAGRGLVDSIDCSTPEQAARFGKVLDRTLRQRRICAFEGGDGFRQRSVPLATFNSWQLADVWTRESESATEQTTLEVSA
jgi:hypothetical protein